MNFRTGHVPLIPTSHFQVRTKTYRRNGQLQSCEPCRKSKLRCDHVVPTCQRCIRRRRGDQCVYLENPLSKNRSSPRAELPTPSTSAADQDSPNIVRLSEFARAQPTSTQEAPPANGAAVQRHRAASAPPLNVGYEPTPRGDPGFLGITSYSSIFADLDNLGIAASDIEASQGWRVVVPRDRMVQSCEVLAFFENKSLINRFVSRIFEIGRGSSNMCVEPIMKQWLLKLSLHHGDVLTRQEPSKILRLCDTLWRNTRSPLAFDGNISPMDWAALGTGANIRWEVIGLMVAVTGVCAATLEPSDSFFAETGVSGLEFARRMKDLSDLCLGFCRDCEVMNDMLLWLVCENACLIGALEGDTSHAFYRATGEEVNTCIAMGLHQKIEANDQVPFFLAELRKQAFIAIYGSEIGMAAFLGRPPRISYRYCTLDRPLDLTEAQLMLEKDDLAAVTSKLDNDGYNTSGRFSRQTRIRAWVDLSCRREDILDLALGQYSREEVLYRAKVIHEKTEEHWAELPPFLRNLRNGPADSVALRPYERLLISYFTQGLRSNELLLQRVLIQKAGASSERLIQEARAMFQTVLRVTQRFDLASNFMMDINSILVIHGLRSAAVVAVELLKQEQRRGQPQQLHPQSHHPHPYHHHHPEDSELLPRSQTIQNLSVFAARLGAVDPRDGSFTICDQGRKVITRILDKILSPPPGGMSSSSNTGISENRFQYQHHHTATAAAAAADHHRAPPWEDTPLLGNTDMLPELAAAPAATTGDLDFGFNAPYLGHDRDFMQWLENVNWDGPEAWIPS